MTRGWHLQGTQHFRSGVAGCTPSHLELALPCLSPSHAAIELSETNCPQPSASRPCLAHPVSCTYSQTLPSCLGGGGEGAGRSLDDDSSVIVMTQQILRWLPLAGDKCHCSLPIFVIN